MTNHDKILDISKRLGLTHIGSCLSVLPILEEIYAKKKSGDKVIMDNAHAHLAHLLFLYQLLPSTGTYFYDQFIQRIGIHCDRAAGCDASGGSLGHGLGIGIGMALANPNIKVSVIVSDGSMMEGSNWEGLRIAGDLQLKNLEIHCNFNGYTAVGEVYREDLLNKMHEVNDHFTTIKYHATDNGEGFEGVEGHYKKL